MADNSLVVEIDLESGDIKKPFDKIEKGAKGSGKKAGKKFGAGFNASLKNVLKTATGISAIAGTIGAALFGKQAIEAAVAQEDAINKLNSSLQISGKFSEQASKDLQKYASGLQEVTRFGDETILETQALINSLGDLDKEGLKGATKAALDLSAALGISLTSAATLVGKAAAGEVGSFSRYGVSIKKGADNAETFTNALTALQAKFGGAAEKDVQTFSGAFQQLQNTFGDLLEEFGFFIIKNGFVLKAIKFLNKEIAGLINTAKEFGASLNFFDDIVEPIINFGIAISERVIAPLELLKDVGNVVFGAINSAAATLVASLGMLGGAIGRLLSSVGVFDGIAIALQDFQEVSEETALEVNKNFTDSLSAFGDMPISDTLTAKAEEIKTGLSEINDSIKEEAEVSKATMDDVATNAVAVADVTSNTIIDVYKGISFQFSKAVSDMSAQTKALAGMLKNGFVKVVSGGIQNVVQSLMKGEDAFKNFGNFLLKTLGGLAIQLGEFYIAQGIALTAMTGLSGPQSLIAGAGLVALGSIMQGLGGGGSDGNSSSGSSAGSFATEPTDASAVATESEDIKESQHISVNVANSFNAEETGRIIIETLNEAFDSTGETLTNARLS